MRRMSGNGSASPLCMHVSRHSTVRAITGSQVSVSDRVATRTNGSVTIVRGTTPASVRDA